MLHDLCVIRNNIYRYLNHIDYTYNVLYYYYKIIVSNFRLVDKKMWYICQSTRESFEKVSRFLFMIIVLSVLLLPLTSEKPYKSEVSSKTDTPNPPSLCKTFRQIYSHLDLHIL